MSFDLYAWKEPRVTDEEEADAVVTRSFGKQSSDPQVCTPHADVGRFYDALLARYPGLEEQGENGPDDSPWSMTPQRSDRMIEMHIRWGGSSEPLDVIVELARRFDLVLYDPQGPSIHSPEPEPEPAADPENSTGEAWSAIRALAVALVILGAGWFIPWRFVGWPMVAIGLLLMALAIYALVVRFIKPDRRAE